MKKVLTSFKGSVKELRENLHIAECRLCEDTGIYHRQDGADDFVDVECVCQLDKDESDLLDLEK